METLKIYSDKVESRDISRAVRVIEDGGLVICPTDTLYAIVCDAMNVRAVEALCRIKGLDPARHLLSLACADISQAAEYVRIDNTAFRILRRYLPGPFTFILPALTRLPKVLLGRKTVGIRVPDNAVIRRIAEDIGHPLMTTSVSLPDVEEMINPESIALHYANDVSLIVDAGEGGSEMSTVVDISDAASPEIVRPGIGEFEL